MSENNELQEVWETALKVIERNTHYSSTTMNLWFNDLKLVMVTDSTVVLVARSNFKRDIVRGDRHRKEIEAAMEELLGYPVSADVRSDEEQKNVVKELTRRENTALPEESPSENDFSGDPSPEKTVTETKEPVGSSDLNPLPEKKRQKHASSPSCDSENDAIPFWILDAEKAAARRKQSQTSKDDRLPPPSDPAVSESSVSEPSAPSSDFVHTAAGVPKELRKKEKEEPAPSDPSSPSGGIDDSSLFSTVGESKIVNYADVYRRGKIEYTFDTFVVGSTNRFAHSACYAAATDPGGNCNPLFLYGPSGLGKTHLLYAITDWIQKNTPEKKVTYVRGEDFTNQLIDAISKNITPEFRERYRKVDVLLIDDIQFIAGKVSTQEEFFHTFNELYESNKQIVMASDRPARDMDTLEERLKTRFESALNADIQPPDMELRIAILQAKASAIGIKIPPDVMGYLAENLRSNVRQLEGAVRKIAAKSFLSGTPITVDLAIRCISDMMTGSEPVSVMVDKIITLVTERYHVSPEDLKSKKRSADIMTPRNLAIYLIRTMTDMSLPAIGKVFQRDHSTILNSLEAVDSKRKSNPSYEAELKELIHLLS